MAWLSVVNYISLVILNYIEGERAETKVALVSAKGTGGEYEESFGVRFPPLAAASLAAVAMQEGFEARFFDASSRKKDAESILESIAEYGPDVAAFIVNASSSAKPSTDLASKLRKSVGMLIAGGHHATFAFPWLLKRGFDAVFLGEGELSFREFLRRLKRGDDWKSVKGVAYSKEGMVISNGMAQMVERLDDLPIPAFEIYDRSSYRMGIFGPEESVASLETSRGCPYNCEYCSVTKMWGARWRLKSSERVIEELRKVKDLGYRWVFFVDDNFIIPVKNIVLERVAMIRKMIREELNSLRYIIQLRADFVAKNEWLPPLLHEAGVRIAFLGIESGDPETLRNMRKNLVPEASAKAVQLLSSNGIIVHGGFMLGAPYEDAEAMKKTVNFATSLIDFGLDSAQFSIYTPLPGTDAFMKAASRGDILTLDWDLYDVLHPVMRTNIPPWRLFLFQRWAQYSFFMKKGLKSLLRGKLFSPPKTEKERLLNRGTKYLARRIPYYLMGLLRLPFSALSIAFKLRRGINEEDKEELSEILKSALHMQNPPREKKAEQIVL
ncbi:MAG: B12-binding domain-containing radical SAM protein [Fervidicoccaceae archaeon]